ncbi:MAG TPA: tRNA (adenosine(37)-N6)-threonylcarbamoyltransferase complex ATPase subunit type 1 TsaE [Flavobacteriales bacterium]|jgi:tRNA threonylcarbamoyladenosine biosynthesis protein TsaE|nr:tRNA (adenosine(37)-N6)-threonylcarbamoyltransferase complex ATPase subunit type 1 TsaE [Flavobacteriales bacterium]
MKHPSTADTPDEEKQLRCIWRSQPYDLSQLRGAVGSFFQHIAWGDVVAVQAPMGTGKTTFVSALAQVLGAQDVASSPTFALCQEYPLEERAGSTEKRTIRHLDLYRIQHDSELRGLGWDELMEDAGAITLVEWPERAADHFPDRAKLLRIERQPDGLRLASLWVRETA